MSSASRTRGRFALRFVDPGPDGVCGTSDDLFRFLANGQYYLSTQSAAKPATDPTLGVDDEGGDIDLTVIVDSSSDDWTPSDGTTDDSTVDISPSSDTTVDDSGGGCGGDSGGDSSSSDSSSGCGGDTGGGTADTSGCSGDTGGDSVDLGGCGGDPGCSGDLQLSPAAKKHASHARGAAKFFPVFAFAFVQVLRRPRSRSAR